jgi:DME family drug/metabolite transporter
MSPQILGLMTAALYAGCFVATRRGLVYSTPITAAYVAVAVNTVVLSTLLLATRGIPDVAWLPVFLFIAAGLLQLGTRLCAYTGVAHLGASITSTIQATNPLIGTTLAVIWLGEVVTPVILLGTGAVVFGVTLISWRPERHQLYHWWYVLFPLGAALTAGVNHPLRRYAMTLANEPLFFAAIMGAAALVPMLLYLVNQGTRRHIVLHPRAIPYFAATGIFEAVGIWLLITALSTGRVVIVAPMVATAPLWVLLATMIFSRDIERINLRTALAAVSVVAGIVVILVT